jgi:hypothetical protein
MPRYFFHVMDGRASIDMEGTELTGMDSVRVEAIRTAGDILSDYLPGALAKDPWQMTVADENGATVYSLRFEAKEYDGHSHSPVWP